MGVDYSSALLVGIRAEDIKPEPDDIYDFVEEKGLGLYREWYDADIDGLIIGVPVSSKVEFEELPRFLEEIKEAFVEFSKVLPGYDQKLISTQDIY